MDTKAIRSNAFFRPAPARTAPMPSSGTLLDDWSERAFGAFKYETPRRAAHQSF